MPIEIKHGTPSSSIVAGAAGGQNARNARLRERQAAAKAQSLLQSDRLSAQAEFRQLDQQHRELLQGQSQEAALERQESAQDARMELTGLGHQHQLERDAITARRLRDNFEFELTAQQEAEEEKLRDALHMIETSEDFTEDEREEARRAVYARLAGIKPLPKRRARYAAGQGIGEVWSDEDAGLVYTRDSSGEVKKLGDLNTGKPTAKERIEAWKAAISLAEDGNKVVDIEKARGYLAEILGSETPGVGDGNGGDLGSPDGGRDDDAIAVPGARERVEAAAADIEANSGKIAALEVELAAHEKRKPAYGKGRRSGAYATHRAKVERWKKQKERLEARKTKLENEKRSALLALKMEQKRAALAQGE